MDGVVQALEKNGIRPLSEPKIGAHGLPVIFVHPKYCNGVLTEFQQTPEAPRDQAKEPEKK